MFWTVSSDNLRKGDADVMKKKNILKIVLISIAVIVLLVLLAAAALFISFMHKYNSISYESVEIVSRTDSYIPPEPPDIVIDADGDPDTTESIHETESVTAESTEGASEHVPPETLPNEIYTPPANNGSNDTAPPVIYDPNKSFMDSDAVSVYGGTPIYKVNQKDPNVENILIVGTDARDVSIHRGLSDVMIVVSYNKSEGTIKLISFLRDSLVHIEGVGWGKLNWAYIRQGIGSTIRSMLPSSVSLAESGSAFSRARRSQRSSRSRQAASVLHVLRLLNLTCPLFSQRRQRQLISRQTFISPR